MSVDNHESNGVTGFSLTVCSQANKYSTALVNVYIERFLSWFEEYLGKCFIGHHIRVSGFFLALARDFYL